MIIEDHFLQAARYGNIKLVKQYIKEGGDIEALDMNDWTALMYASKEGHLDIVKYLIGAGADINTKDNNWTAFMWASWKGHLEVVKYLIVAGVDIDAKSNKGDTALTLASQKGHTEVVKVLENPNEYLLRKKLDIENASDVIKDSCIF